MDVTTRNPVFDHGPLTLVVGFDLSQQAVFALEEGIALAATSGGAVLHVVGVAESAAALDEAAADSPGDRIKEMQDRIAVAVEAALSRCGRPGIRVLVHVRIGRAADEILALAGDVEASLIIVGTHGRRGLERLLLGSVAERVMREAACPVLVMRPARYAHDAAIAPEPPCPACVSHRGETAGAEWWCATHAKKPWIQPHRYSYTDAGINRMRPDEWPLW